MHGTRRRAPRIRRTRQRRHTPASRTTSPRCASERATSTASRRSSASAISISAAPLASESAERKRSRAAPKAHHGGARGHDLHEVRKRRPLVGAAQQQNHAGVGKRRERLLDGVGVRRLRVVDVAHALDLAHGLDAMRQRREGREPGTDALGRRPAGQRGRGGGEGVQHVVVAGDLELVGAHERRLPPIDAHHQVPIAHKGGVRAARIGKAELEHAAAGDVHAIGEGGDAPRPRRSRWRGRTRPCCGTSRS